MENNNSILMPELKCGNWKGKLVVFCGVDGAGKTTQINNVSKMLSKKGYKVFCTFQPSRHVRDSEVFKLAHSKDIEKINYTAMLLMTVGDRIHHCTYEIRRHLQDGEIVLCDRYIYTTIANMMVEDKLDQPWFKGVVKDIFKPDIVFLMDVDSEIAIERIKARPEEKDIVDEGYIRKMVDAYRMLAQYNNMILIDSSRMLDDVSDKIVENLLDK